MKAPNLFLVTLTILLLISTAGSAQNFSGLQDKTLHKTDDTGNFVKDLLTSQLKGGLTGNILDVTVMYDSHENLKLRIDYEGFKNARMTIAVQDKRKKDQELIIKEEFSLKRKASPLEVTLSLSKSAQESKILISSYLALTISSSANDPIAKLTSSLAKKTFLFRFPTDKKWQKEINPENITIPVSLEPVGSAMDLKEFNQVLVKPRINPRLKTNIVNPAFLRKPVPAAVIKAITTAELNPVDGIWINTDKNTKGITKIVISDKGKKIRVYEKCSPKDCDWGLKALTAGTTSKIYNAVYGRGAAVSNLTLDFTKDLKLIHNKINIKGNRSIKTGDVFKRLRSVPAVGTIRSSTTPQGPDNKPISLWDDLIADNNFEFPHEITNIRMDIYPDKNPESGVFYYLPNAYHLRWNPDEGYQFKMLYGTADDASSGSIRMTCTLTSAIGNTEVTLVKSLLESYMKNNPDYTYKELRIIPLKSNPTISLSAGLEGQHNIDADKINVGGVQSTITAPIDISWITDSRTRKEMQVALSEGVGIHGIMTLVPDSETIPEQLIPIRITLADTRTLGRFTLDPGNWRTKKWTNITPYPLKLKFIHALVIEKEGNRSIPLIYSWSLGDKEIPSGANARFNADKMPEWLEENEKTKRIWIGYAIGECKSCINNIMDEITGGTSQ